MRLSHLFAPTLRDDPSEADVASHRLLLRAGFVRQLASGLYTSLPLGVRSMRKIENVVRQEMDDSGAQEIRMPNVLPSEAWKATGRWDLYGEQLFHVIDRHERELLLGPTHEEVVAPLVAAESPSYRSLPLNLYQVGWKYRDEFRPRFGLLRVRELLMKDAYSFDRDEEGMRASYDAMLRAYRRMYDRLGLSYVVVEAEAGQIGGGINHEFMARADVGEDLFVECENGDYLADMKAARPRPPDAIDQGDLQPLEVLDTPNTPTIDALAAFLRIPAERTLKNILFDAGGQTLAVLVPGDREVAEEKLEQLFFPTPIRRFEDVDFAERGFAKGYVGPQGLPDDAVVIADHSVRAGKDWVTGANRTDHHVVGANTPRDFRVDRYEDVIEIREGDRCPNDGGALRVGRSIVVAHVFQLGTKYSAPLKATFIDEDGTEQLFQMGCYGVGISRTLAAAAEQYHDDAGLMWPKVMAPFDAVVIVANGDDEEVASAAETVYLGLRSAGLDPAIDDRDVAAGVKFNDADLIGYPVQVVVGRRGLRSGSIDLKLRATGERSQAPLAKGVEAVRRLWESAP
jgi:prolyl-tRNA synthetase